jgi:hypothetical protein
MGRASGVGGHVWEARAGVGAHAALAGTHCWRPTDQPMRKRRRELIRERSTEE